MSGEHERVDHLEALEARAKRLGTGHGPVLHAVGSMIAAVAVVEHTVAVLVESLEGLERAVIALTGDPDER